MKYKTIQWVLKQNIKNKVKATRLVKLSRLM